MSGPKALFAALLTLLCASPAHAWQCNRVRDNNGQPTGSALYWPTRAIPYTFNQRGSAQLPRDASFNAIREAFNTWQSSTLRPTEPMGCSTQLADPGATSTDLSFVEGALTDQDFAGYSVLNPNVNRNVVIFRDDAWAYPLTGDQTADYMSMTTVTYNKLSGEILDADVEFNSFGYRFTLDDSNVIYDLQNVASHEVGHFLGFGHATDANATMYKTAEFGEISKRLLSCDDAVGLWFRFPAGGSTMNCSGGVIDDACGQCAAPAPLKLTPTIKVQRAHDGHGGCTCQGSEPAGWAGVFGALLALRRACQRRLRRLRRGLDPRMR